MLSSINQRKYTRTQESAFQDYQNKNQKVKVQDLQKECKHPKKLVKSIQENEDSSTFVIRWICSECEAIVGIPNDEELNNFLKQ